MEKSKLDNKMLKVGKTTFNKEALKGITKDEFEKTYRGKLNVDIKEAWVKVKPFTKMDEKPEIKKEVKPDSKKSDKK